MLKRRATYVLSAFLAVGVLAGAALAAAGGSPPQGRVRVGSTTPLPAGARITGTTAPSTSLRLTIALEPQDASALSNYATDVSTPGSALFRHYLTVPQFADRFGATDAHIAAVESALRAARLKVGTVTANKLTIPVTGTAAQVESAFSVSLAQVTLAERRVAHANQQAPALPATIAKYVQGVIGLNDVTLDQPQGLRARPPVAPCSRRAPPAHREWPAPCIGRDRAGPGGQGYTADEIAGAYGFNSFYAGGTRAPGQTSAVFEEEPYQSQRHQSSRPVTARARRSAMSTSTGDQRCHQGPHEAALDIEQIIGLAPKANILVYQGPPTATSPADILTAMVSQDRAKVLSSSWGGAKR